MTRLSDWFKKMREHNVLKMMAEHLDLTAREIEELYAFINGRGGYKKIDALEKEADELRRRISIEIAKSELPPDDKGDLMSFVREMDDIADFINAVGRSLSIFHELPPEKHKLLKEMCENCMSAVYALRESFKEFMAGNKEKAFELTNKVEGLEEAVDEQYHTYQKLALKQDRGTGVALIMHSIFLAMENTADACEDTADELRILLVKFW